MKPLFSLFTIAILVFLSGCAATGSRFQPAQQIKPGYAHVVFYRPSAFQGGAVSWTVSDNGERLLSLKNGQFVAQDMAPGAYKLHTSTGAIDRPLEITLEEGKTYYIRTDMRVGMWAGSIALTRVYDEQALQELATCCKSGTKE